MGREWVFTTCYYDSAELPKRHIVLFNFDDSCLTGLVKGSNTFEVLNGRSIDFDFKKKKERIYNLYL